METNYKVYIHTCPNKKVYVGITRQEPEKRWLKGNGYFNTPYFYNAIKKYGWENIRHEVVCEGLTKQQAEEKEIELIALYRSSERDFGYNIEKGGKSIGRFSQETIEKIRKSATGRVVSQETREKLSKINKGKKMPIEAVKKMAETQKGKKFSQETKNKMSQYAKNRSPEHLKKLSESHKGRKIPFETVIKKWKPIIQIGLNGEFIRKFGSATQAFQETGIDKRQINNCCKGRQKTAHGFIWKYDTNM